MRGFQSALPAILVMASVALVGSQRAVADASACGMLTVHVDAKSIEIVNGRDYCLSLIYSGPAKDQVTAVHFSGLGANDTYSINQVNKGVDLVPPYPGLLRLTGRGMTSASGGVATLTYKGAKGMTTDQDLELVKRGASWSTEVYKHTINYANLTVEVEGAGDKQAPIITGVSFTYR